MQPLIDEVTIIVRPSLASFGHVRPGWWLEPHSCFI